MKDLLGRIEECGVVPVVVLNDANDADPVADALCGGGLPCAEITFRTDAAEAAIAEIANRFPEMCVGAGTVLSVDQVRRAAEAGAEFIVTPGFDPEVVDCCIAGNIPVIPGCATPSDISQAVKRGLKVVKFFPAEQYGGVTAIKALSAPFPGLKFMPTGGVSAGNLADYLSCDRVCACGGSWMVKKELIASENYGRIRELASEAVGLVRKVRGGNR